MMSPMSNAADQPNTSPVQRQPAAHDPFVVLTVLANGIHPATSRIIALDAVTLDAEHQVVQEFYRVLNPGGNPGPQHLHGLTHAEVAAGEKMSRVLKNLDKLIDGRTLILHDAPTAWGFLYSEARRTMLAAARANRKRSREGGPKRRRQRVGHVPRPIGIVDTLASARRQGYQPRDTRLRTLSTELGLTASPEATVERAALPAAQGARELTLLTQTVWETLASHIPAPMVTLDPQTLKADRFGLQHSLTRVTAMKTTPTVDNPGLFAGKVQPGMVFAIAPDVTADPDQLIEAGVNAGMFYVEKLTRETSLVVTNAHKNNLRGKAMHALRKGIPLLTDAEFLDVTAAAMK